MTPALRVSLGALALATAGELAARAWIRHGRVYQVNPPGLRLRLEPDPAVSPYLERRVRFDVNREGERGDEPPRRTAGLYRVLVVGGSQPECLFLDQDSSWPSALQRLLAQPRNRAALGASRVHVGCVARSGVGSEAVALILRKILPRYRRLDAIVILVGASDVLRWLEEGAPAAPSASPRVPQVFRWHPEMRFGWRPQRSALFELARRLRRRWLRPLEVQAGAGHWMISARRRRQDAAALIDRLPDPQPMLDHFERCLGDAVRFAASRAGRVILVHQPWLNRPEGDATGDVWNGGVGRAWKQEITTFYSMGVLNRLMVLMNERAARVCAAQGIETVDVMPLLEPNREHYYDFVHGTPNGAAIVARAVADAIVRPARRARDAAAVPAAGAAPDRRIVALSTN